MRANEAAQRGQAEEARNNETKLRQLAEANEKKAETAAAKSQQVAQFLKEMIEGVGPSVAKGRDTTMLREVLERTIERIGRDLKGQPEIEAELENLTSQELRRLALKSWSAFVAKEAGLEMGNECSETDPQLLAALDEALEKAASNPNGFSGNEVRARLRTWISK